MTTSPVDSPGSSALVRPRRWWRVRLSLRALLVLILLISLPLGWIARRASIQRRAVATVRALGGTIAYEDEIDARGYSAGLHRPWGPAWLRRVVGDEPFQEVVAVNFNLNRPGCRVDDESIAALADFDHLQVLYITATTPEDDTQPARPITARGLERLAGLSRLRFLTLNFLRTDAAMMSLLPRWPALEEVSIFDQQDQPRLIPGSSLRHLGELPHLRYVAVISVASSQPEDLAPLAKLKHLESVWINRATVDDATIRSFGAMPALYSLDLPSAQLTPAMLGALAQNSTLQTLVFDGAALPPGGLRALAGLPRLSELSVLRDGQTAFPSMALKPLTPPRLSDADLDDLHDVPLRNLNLTGLDATDAGVARLLSNHTFDLLALGGRGVTDASIPLLLKQTSLGALALTDTSITDAGLAQLAALTGLSDLSLVANAALTDGGVARLTNFPALTSLRIHQPAVQSATLDTIRAAARSKSGFLNLIQPPEEAAR